ncbi:MAG: hypothetical protein CMI54_01615 [Parcubacteria group bacterium]|nr:hypothetical protein [Parcubacteria group bacterium]|tara:strand:+ start:25122 stop:25607 length:486 start_codon:yes stop_codon:yes gene_type:complete
MNIFDVVAKSLKDRLEELSLNGIDCKKINCNKISQHSYERARKFSGLYEFIENFALENHRKPTNMELPKNMQSTLRRSVTGLNYEDFLTETGLIKLPGSIDNLSILNNTDVKAIREEVRLFRKKGAKGITAYLEKLAEKHHVSDSTIKRIIYSSGRRKRAR